MIGPYYTYRGISRKYNLYLFCIVNRGMYYRRNIIVSITNAERKREFFVGLKITQAYRWTTEKKTGAQIQQK